MHCQKVLEKLSCQSTQVINPKDTLNTLVKKKLICIVKKCLKAKLSKYPSHKSELVSHLNIDNSEIFDTQPWTAPKDRCGQVSAGSSHRPVL